MSYFRSILLPAACLSAMFFSGPAAAQSEILFKIGNIRQVDASAGNVASCNFEVTVFNRSAQDLRSATLELAWEDKAIDIMDEEEKTGELTPEAFMRMVDSIAPDAAKTRQNLRPVRTRADTPTTLRKSVNIPSIPSYSQAIVNSVLDTDRCFLLMQKASFTVRGCQMGGAQSGGGGGQCGNFFKYISSKDEQYYRDFKKMTVNEQRAESASRQEKLKQELNQAYENVVKRFEEASAIMSSAK